MLMNGTTTNIHDVQVAAVKAAVEIASRFKAIELNTAIENVAAAYKGIMQAVIDTHKNS